MWEAIRAVVGAILSLVLVCWLAWLVLRWMNRRLPGLGGASTGRMIHVLDRVTVGKNSVVLLLRVRDTVMLVAVSEHAVQKLGEFDASDGSFEAAVQTGGLAFSEALRDAAGKVGFGKKGGGDHKSAHGGETDEK